MVSVEEDDLASLRQGSDFDEFSNPVIATSDHLRSPEVQEAAALFANSSLSLEDRLAAFNWIISLAGKAQPPHMRLQAMQVLNIAPHKQMLSELADFTTNLSKGKFANTHDIGFKTLVGAPGIGKTYFLTAFTLACPVVFPTVIPVFLCQTGVRDLFKSSKPEFIELLISAAQAHGVTVTNTNRDFHELAGALAAAGRHMLLIVDKFELMYSVSSDLDPSYLKTLGWLNYLPRQSSGRIAVVLSGSYQFTRDLTWGSDSWLRSRYPLLRDAFHKPNEYAYRVIQIHSVRCNDSGQALSMMNQMRLWPKLTDAAQRRALSRILTFFVQCVPRAFLAAELAMDHQDKMSTCFATLHEACCIEASQTRRFHTQDSAILFEVITPLLHAANAELIKRVCNADGLVRESELVAISSPPWEDLVRPVPLDEARRAWVARHEDSKSYLLPFRFNSALDDLADAQCISVERKLLSDAGHIWPVTAYQVTRAHA